MISGSFKAGRKRQTEKEVIVSIDHHLILELAEMQKRIGGSD